MPITFSLSLPAIVALGVGTTAAILVNTISYVMIGKINERLPKEERMSYLGMGTNVRKKFKQLYPGDKLAWLYDFCLAITILSFFAVIRFWVDT